MGKFRKEWIKGKSIVVLGLAKSGLAVSGLLVQMGAKVTVNDQKPEHELKGVDELRKLGITVITGYHPEDLIHEGIDLVVKNPGIPYTSSPIQTALHLHIPVITEVELAFAWSKAPIIGITGSNGKTTTTTLVGQILEVAQKHPIVAGNIGTVLCEKAQSARSDEILVAELSSFQLKGTDQFRPQIGCLLNITPAHLDYHGTWEDYIQSKAKLFANMGEEETAVLNADNEGCLQVAEKLNCPIAWFSRKKQVENGAFVKGGYVYFQQTQQLPEKIIAVEQIAMPGSHNLENALAAVSICKSLGVENQAICEVLARFQGVEHRLEFVALYNGIKYYNNSKATNTEATIKALESFKEPIILIAGGLDRGFDFMEMVPLLKDYVKGLVAYGQTKEKFMNIGQLAGLNYLSSVDNVKEAVKTATQIAEPGDIVLLSPACASWDMYSSFEERGSIFKESVHKLNTSLH